MEGEGDRQSMASAARKVRKARRRLSPIFILGLSVPSCKALADNYHSVPSLPGPFMGEGPNSGSRHHTHTFSPRARSLTQPGWSEGFSGAGAGLAAPSRPIQSKPRRWPIWGLPANTFRGWLEGRSNGLALILFGRREDGKARLAWMT